MTIKTAQTRYKNAMRAFNSVGTLPWDEVQFHFDKFRQVPKALIRQMDAEERHKTQKLQETP